MARLTPETAAEYTEADLQAAKDAGRLLDKTFPELVVGSGFVDTWEAPEKDKDVLPHERSFPTSSGRVNYTADTFRGEADGKVLPREHGRVLVTNFRGGSVAEMVYGKGGNHQRLLWSITDTQAGRDHYERVLSGEAVAPPNLATVLDIEFGASTDNADQKQGHMLRVGNQQEVIRDGWHSSPLTNEFGLKIEEHPDSVRVLWKSPRSSTGDGERQQIRTARFPTPFTPIAQVLVEMPATAQATPNENATSIYKDAVLERPSTREERKALLQAFPARINTRTRRFPH